MGFGQLGMSIAAAQVEMQADFVSYTLLLKALKLSTSRLVVQGRKPVITYTKSVRNGAAKGLIRGALNGAGVRAIPAIIPDIVTATEIGGEAGTVGGPVGIGVGALGGAAIGAGAGVSIGFAKSAVCKAMGF